MKDFFRSAHYALHYKARVAAAVVCVVLIAITWAGGLGAIIPGAKILISPEGLHGWVDQTNTHSRLGIRTLRRKVSAEKWAGIHEVMVVNSVAKDGPAEGAALAAGHWILGTKNSQGSETRLAFDDLHQHLANLPVDQTWTLMLYDPGNGRSWQVSVAPRPEDFKARWLKALTARLARPKDTRDRFALLAWLLIAVGVLTVFRDLLRLAQGYLVRTMSMRAVMDIRCENYATALRLPLDFYSTRGASDTMSRFIDDTSQVGAGLIVLFGKTLVEPAKLVGCFAMALWLNWKLTLLACVAGPPAYLLINQLGKVMRRATRKALTSRSRMLGALDETLHGIRVVKAYTTEHAEERRFRRINRQLYKESKSIAAAGAATAPSVEALGVIATLAASALAAYWVFEGQLDREVFLTLMALLAAMYDPVRKLSQVATQFHAADAAAKRVFELRDSEIETDRPNAHDLPRHQRSIEFRNVTFTYPNALRPALQDVSLDVRQGECVALVGANGSGKTTLMSLLPRFFKPDRGAVLVDGVDIADVALQSLRRQIAVVTQETVLFNASVAANIAYGEDAIDEQRIREVAAQAFVDEFVRDLPDGYDAVVGEGGATLSGGQRQRIAIARAILRDPAILIFDEATSQIDSESEAKIHQALETFMAGRTTFLIAHRFSTVVSADRVAVMEDGRIVDAGPHAELLGRCKVYRTLFETQLISDTDQA